MCHPVSPQSPPSHTKPDYSIAALLRAVRATQKAGTLHNAPSTGLPLTWEQEKQKLYSKQGHQSEPPSCLLTVWGSEVRDE